MSVHFSDISRHVAADGTVTPEEIASLRKLGWESGHICKEEAEAIFAINRQLAQPSAEWVDFFVEALGEFVVNGTAPRGYVDQAEADWLIGALDHDGHLDSMAELELMVRVMERAANVPDTLKHYALSQIEKVVLTGTGPTRCGGALSDTHVTEAEAKLLRRMVFASAGMSPASVHRHEAEMLFRLKDATLGHDNSPEWQRLFVQGVGNYLMGFSSGISQISHERAKDLESFVADNSSNVGRFFRRMAKSAPSAMKTVFGGKDTGPTYLEQVAAAQTVDGKERDWLDRQIEANGELDAFDRALLDFIAEIQAEG